MRGESKMEKQKRNIEELQSRDVDLQMDQSHMPIESTRSRSRKHALPKGSRNKHMVARATTGTC